MLNSIFKVCWKWENVDIICYKLAFLCNKEMSKNPKSRLNESIKIFWTTWGRKMWLMIILKATKSPSFTLSLEDTFLEKPQGGQIDPLSLFRVKCVSNLAWTQNFHRQIKFKRNGNRISSRKKSRVFALGRFCSEFFMKAFYWGFNYSCQLNFRARLKSPAIFKMKLFVTILNGFRSCWHHDKSLKLSPAYLKAQIWNILNIIEAKSNLPDTCEKNIVPLTLQTRVNEIEKSKSCISPERCSSNRMFPTSRLLRSQNSQLKLLFLKSQNLISPTRLIVLPLFHFIRFSWRLGVLLLKKYSLGYAYYNIYFRKAKIILTDC